MRVFCRTIHRLNISYKTEKSRHIHRIDNNARHEVCGGQGGALNCETDYSPPKVKFYYLVSIY